MRESLCRRKPVGMGETACSGHNRDDEGHKGLGRRDGVGAGVGEWHQHADVPGQPDFFEEADETDIDHRRG